MKSAKLVVSILAIIAIGSAVAAISNQSFFPTPSTQTKTQSETVPSPIAVRLPFSWDEYFAPVSEVDPYAGSNVLAIRITLHNITYLGIESGGNRSYVYRVYYAMNYLLDKQWISNSGIVGPDFEIVTALGDHYHGQNSCSYALSQFRPFEGKYCYATVQTKQGEVPVQVAVYEFANRPPPQGQSAYLAYVWNLQTNLYA